MCQRVKFNYACGKTGTAFQACHERGRLEGTPYCRNFKASEAIYQYEPGPCDWSQCTQCYPSPRAAARRAREEGRSMYSMDRGHDLAETYLRRRRDDRDFTEESTRKWEKAEDERLRQSTATEGERRRERAQRREEALVWEQKERELQRQRNERVARARNSRRYDEAIREQRHSHRDRDHHRDYDYYDDDRRRRRH